MLFAFAKEGNCAQAPSGGGAPSTEPSRSPGPLIPFDLRPMIAKGGLSYTIIMAVTGAPGFWSRNLISELMSANPKGNEPVATFGIASSEPFPGEISTFKSAAAKCPLSIARK